MENLLKTFSKLYIWLESDVLSISQGQCKQGTREITTFTSNLNSNYFGQYESYVTIQTLACANQCRHSALQKYSMISNPFKV